MFFDSQRVVKILHFKTQQILSAGLLLIPIAAFSQGHPDRWIVVNPKNVNTASPSHQRVLQVGPHRFWVIDATEGSALSLFHESEAEAIYPDFPIRSQAFNSDVESTQPDGQALTAWHTSYLKYNELDPQSQGKGVIVALLDTGVETTHPALKNQLWINTNEIPSNGIDDDHNGWIDDYHGINLLNRSGDLTDRNGHGTHCAGNIVGSYDRNTGAQGIAPEARLMGIKLIGSRPDKSTYLSDAAAGVVYAVDHGARVLSNSWRIYSSWTDYMPNETNLRILSDAIRYADERGAIFVAGAGNDALDLDKTSDPLYPAQLKGHDNLLVVTASDALDGKADFSNFGMSAVHLAAPGVDIVSTFLDGRWRSMKGTSMATPIVSGTLARGLSAGFRSRELLDHLMSSVKATVDFRGRIRSEGIVDPLRFQQSF